MNAKSVGVAVVLLFTGATWAQSEEELAELNEIENQVGGLRSDLSLRAQQQERLRTTLNERATRAQSAMASLERAWAVVIMDSETATAELQRAGSELAQDTQDATEPASLFAMRRALQAVDEALGDLQQRDVNGAREAMAGAYSNLLGAVSSARAGATFY